jgi:peptidyl-prolyl cis-trans isomerase D
MLQAIRDKAQGWIAWAIVILISIPFALWGIQEYLGAGAEPVVASVNDEEITERDLDQRFNTFRQQLRERLGAAYKPEMFDNTRMRAEVLQEMIRGSLLRQVSHDMGLRVGDQLIRSAILGIEAFQVDGHFDKALYERGVRLQGTSEAGFEQRVRQALLSEQLSQAVQNSVFATQREIEELIRLRNQTRDAAYFTLPVADFLSDEEIPADSVESYYQSHQNEFLAPEQVKIEYLLLSAEAIAPTLDVQEEALRGYYEAHLESYGRPEQRRASHILVQVAQDADEATVAAAKEKIASLRQRVEAGEAFADLAKSESQDPGSAAAGGDLGFFGKGIMDPAFESATFALKEGELSEAVRSSFGFHLIRLSEIKSGDVKSFEEARQEVESAYRKAEAERLYFEYAERLADLSYEDPSSLEPAASTLELKIEQSDWLTRDGGAGVLSSPKVMAAAFSEDVLLEHNNSEVIELDQTRSLVLRVVDHQEASLKAMDEVKAEIIETIRQQQAAEKAKAEAEKRLAQLQAGESIEAVAGDYSTKQLSGVKRSERGVPYSLLSDIFSAPRPKDGKPTLGITRLGKGDYAVYALSAVSDGNVKVADEAAKQREIDNLKRLQGRSDFNHLLHDMKGRAKIAITLQTEATQ